MDNSGKREGGGRRRTGLVQASTAAKSVASFQKEVKTKEESDKIFRKLDEDNSKSACIDEISDFVASQDDLWHKISDKLKQPRAMARDAATRVAMELASGKQGKKALEAELSKDQFHKFRKKYILDPDGKEEFMQRAIFALFDKDNSGELDEEELQQFLDTIYESGHHSSKRGRGGPRDSLIAKDEMKELILKNCDKDGNKTLSFEEIQTIIRPSAGTEGLKEFSKAVAEEQPEQQTPEQQAPSPTSTSKEPPKQEQAPPLVLQKPKQSMRLGEKPTSLKKVDNISAKKQAKALQEDQEDPTFCDWLEKKTGSSCRNRSCVVS